MIMEIFQRKLMKVCFKYYLMNLIKSIVFKQKRRKGYQKKNGHKQAYTKILIQDLKSTAAKKPASKKPVAKKQQLTKKKLLRSNYGP